MQENIALAIKTALEENKDKFVEKSRAIDADLKQLRLIFSVYEKYDPSIATKNIQEEVAERLFEELDYDLEARHTKLYAHLLRDEKDVHVAQVKDDLSTGRLLTTRVVLPR